MGERQYHLQVEAGEIGEYVLLHGDPGRCERIAERLDGARLVAANRELIVRFEQKIQATLARIWGEPAPAAPET